MGKAKDFFLKIIGVPTTAPADKKAEGKMAPASNGTHHETEAPRESEAHNEPEVKTAAEPAAPVFKNAIDTEDQLIKGLLKAMRPMLQGNHSLSHSVLHVLIDNIELKMSFNEILSDGTFRDKLAEKISDEWGVEFANIEIETKRDPDAEYVTAIDQVAYYRITTAEPKSREDVIDTPTVPMRATITVLAGGGNGSLKQEVYELNGMEILELPGGQCNIGAGDKRNNIQRNHIVINDSEQDSEYERNKFVSRSHAHIKFSPKAGFLFYADERGLRIHGKRTQVTSHSQLKEFTNTFMSHQLKDGDIITLGKAVNLQFNLIKD